MPPPVSSASPRPADTTALGPSLEQRRLRRAQSAPRNRAGHRRHADGALRPLQRTQSRSRGNRAGLRLEWVVLRLGGVLSVDPKAIPFNADARLLRKHSADRRPDAQRRRPRRRVGVRRGDDRRRSRRNTADRRRRLPSVLQGEVGSSAGCRPRTGRRHCHGAERATRTATTTGSSPTGWTPRRAQEALAFQHHSWSDMLDEARARAGGLTTLLGWPPPLSSRYSSAARPTGNNRASTQTRGVPSIASLVTVRLIRRAVRHGHVG